MEMDPRPGDPVHRGQEQYLPHARERQPVGDRGRERAERQVPPYVRRRSMERQSARPARVRWLTDRGVLGPLNHGKGARVSAASLGTADAAQRHEVGRRAGPVDWTMLGMVVVDCRAYGRIRDGGEPLPQTPAISLPGFPKIIS